MLARGLAVVAAVAALAAVVVAGAETGGGPAGPAAAPAAAAPVLRAVLILAALAEVAVLALVGWALWPDRRAKRRVVDRGGLRMMMLASFLQAVLVILLIWLRARAGHGGLGSLFAPRGGTPAGQSVPNLASAPGLPAGGDWLTALIVIAVVAIALYLFLFQGRVTRRRPRALVAERLAAVAADGIEELPDAADPREAVIRAYARMTQTLAAHGYPRAAQETPLEYMVATFQKLGAAPTGITRLTLLFNEARYSDHPVGEGMRDEAIAALAAVRADLEVAARRERSTLAAAAG